jgi:broad specificity phosphatase PhoE
MRVPIHPPEIPDDPNAPRPERAASSGTNTRVWLVRHAEVHDDWQKRAYGNMDIPLSVEGVRQTEQLAARFANLNISSVATSSLSRALAMGRAIAESTHSPLSIDPRLREVSRGDWQGLATDDFRARWAADARNFISDPWRWKGHNGESDLDLYARGWPVLLERVAISRGADVVIASHFNLIRALITGALGWTGRESFAFRTETARAALLVDTPRGWTLVANNVEDPSTIEATTARTAR